MVVLSTVEITQNTVDKTVEKTESNVHLWVIRTLISNIPSPFRPQCCFVRESFVAKDIFQKINGNIDREDDRRRVVFASQFEESGFEMSLSQQVLSTIVMC